MDSTVAVHTTKLTTLTKEDFSMMSGMGCYSNFIATPRRRRTQSAPDVHEDILNSSPRLLHPSQTLCVDRRQHYQASSCLPGMASPMLISTDSASSEAATEKPINELVKEIATLELEVINLERYLLSLYRTAFEQYLCSSPTVTAQAFRSSLQSDAGSKLEETKAHIIDKLIPNIQNCCSHSEWDVGKKNNPKNICGDSSSPMEDFNQEPRKSASSHRSLAEHLGASLMAHVPDIPCKLSQDIIRCISAVYCKLSDPVVQPQELISSCTPSASSSSTFSPQENDSWSPRCHYEATASPSLLESVKDKQYSSNGMVEIPWISVDGNRFGYASKMLSIFRSLVQRLETIDPTKMSQEGQLAFWINIHNALVMHALLAYGLHQKQIKNTYSILKASYNVGGRYINAYDIQSSILGCLPRLPTLWIRVFFTPPKYKKGNEKHPYALDRPEPLAHFALSSGAHSDPAVRVYCTQNIYQDLKQSKEDFIRTNVMVRKDSRIMLPKILYYYAKDASLELPDLLETLLNYVPESQKKFIRGLKGNVDKFIQWLPYNSTFRYLLHTELASQQEQNFPLAE